MKGADVAIIGGGVVGASVAYALARRGFSDVVLLEREKLLGTGSTARSAGGVRMQFSTEVNILLSKKSIDLFEHLSEELGADVGYKPYGYLFLATRPEDLRIFEANVALQRRLGVPVETLAPREVLARWPFLETRDVLGATFCPRDGFADPGAIVIAYAARAREMGTRVETGVDVTGAVVEGGRLRALRTTAGDLPCRRAVVATGPRARETAALFGADLPIVPYRRNLFVTDPFPAVPEKTPLTIDFENGFYFRPESGGLMLGLAKKDEPPGYDITTDWDYLPEVVEAAIRRVPGLAEAGIANGWAGCYDTTPDHHPVLGPVDGIEGLFIAAGFSGHGFMHSPAAGIVIAEEIIDGEPRTVDTRRLRPDRFRKGHLVEERNVI